MAEQDGRPTQSKGTAQAFGFQGGVILNEAIDVDN